MAYPELVSGGGGGFPSHIFKGLVTVVARMVVIRVGLKKSWPGGGGVSGQPENPPGYATEA